MREIDRESDEFELSMIDRWLDFADQALKHDKKRRASDATDQTVKVA